jgi:uncharacterized membrane protein
VNFLTRVPKRLNPFNDLHPFLSNLLNLGVGLAVPLLLILIIGLMARNIAGRWLLDVGERLLQAIPFAGSVYKTLKQLLETLFKDTRSKFRRVILVEYPRRGMWAIAFVTGTIANSMQPNLPGSMLSIFIPTTPNPTTGWYAIVPEDDVINLSMSIEDAFKVLISGGIVGPSSFPLPAPPDADSPNSAALNLSPSGSGSPPLDLESPMEQPLDLRQQSLRSLSREEELG